MRLESSFFSEAVSQETGPAGQKNGQKKTPDLQKCVTHVKINIVQEKKSDTKFFKYIKLTSAQLIETQKLENEPVFFRDQNAKRYVNCW